MASFAERLQELIKEKGISQTEFTRQVGISRSLPTYWNRGEILPKSTIQTRIADYFGVSIDYLMGKTDDRHPAQVRLPVIGMVMVGQDLTKDSYTRTETADGRYAGGGYVWVENPDDAMFPRLERGDLLLVRIGGDIPSGSVGIVLLDGMACVRTVEKAPQGVALRGGTGMPPSGYYGEERERVREYGTVVQVRRYLAQ